MASEDTDGSLAMTTCHPTEFVQDPTLFFLGRNPIAPPQGCGVFLPCQLGHNASSRFFGNRIYEAPPTDSVTVLMRKIEPLTCFLNCNKGKLRRKSLPEIRRGGAK